MVTHSVKYTESKGIAIYIDSIQNNHHRFVRLFTNVKINMIFTRLAKARISEETQ